jgi:hypothetical protein
MGAGRPMPSCFAMGSLSGPREILCFSLGRVGVGRGMGFQGCPALFRPARRGLIRVSLARGAPRVRGTMRRGPAWTGLRERGPAWTGLRERGLAWTGLRERGLAWTGLKKRGPLRFSLALANLGRLELKRPDPMSPNPALAGVAMGHQRRFQTRVSTWTPPHRDWPNQACPSRAHRNSHRPRPPLNVHRGRATWSRRGLANWAHQ